MSHTAHLQLHVETKLLPVKYHSELLAKHTGFPVTNHIEKF